MFIAEREIGSENNNDLDLSSGTHPSVVSIVTTALGLSFGF